MTTHPTPKVACWAPPSAKLILKWTTKFGSLAKVEKDLERWKRVRAIGMSTNITIRDGKEQQQLALVEELRREVGELRAEDGAA